MSRTTTQPCTHRDVELVRIFVWFVIIKRFLYAHSGFDRRQIQAYLNLYSFVLNPPFDRLEKVDIILNLVFQNPKLLRYRNRTSVNKGFFEKICSCTAEKPVKSLVKLFKACG